MRLLGVDVLEFDSGKISRIDTLFNVVPAIEQALRLKAFSKSKVARTAAVWLQRCLALWLRNTTKGRE